MAFSQMYRLMCVVIFSLSFVSVQSMAKVGYNPLLYQINIKGKTAYLFGSIHIGQADFYPLPLQVERAFSLASALVVEAKPNNDEILPLMLKYGRKQYPINKEVQSLLTQYCQSRAQFCAQIADFSPWVQALQISLMRYGSMGLSGQFGVDVTLMRKNGDRPLYELESTEAQLSLLASFSGKIQWNMLKESIHTSRADMLLLVDAWRQGNEPLLTTLIEGQLIESNENIKRDIMKEKTVTDSEGSLTELTSNAKPSSLISQLLWQRNQTMALGIERLLNNQDLDVLFVVVGVGHLVGDKNIQSVLLKKGATIKNCWQQDCFNTQVK
ncbi:TraB/GumN family protein [uncultured Shewanella sp.]|uniref:TraB/GumN family protein n=1 Tax=uncultured Shewanella sp. TaxID=173975 RepID=UPI00262BC018|nr:TraB/GumN family protein [uncultured Shewanella sp.]